MAGGGRMNPKGRSAAEDWRDALFWTRSVMREEGRRPGKKVRNAGFMRPPFAIGPSSRRRRMGASSAIDRETDGVGITAYVTDRSTVRGVPLALGDVEKHSRHCPCQRIGRAIAQSSHPSRAANGTQICGGWNRFGTSNLARYLAILRPDGRFAIRQTVLWAAAGRSGLHDWRSKLPRIAERQSPHAIRREGSFL